MKKYLNCFMLLILCCGHHATAADASEHLTEGFKYQISKVPDWVIAHQIPSDVSNSIKQGAVSYLLNDEQLTLRNADFKRYRHSAVSANTKQGLEQVSSFDIYFSPEFQTLDLHYIRVVRDGKLRDVTATADIRLVQPEQESERNIYNGLVAAMILLSDVQVGDQIEYAYTINGTNPIYGTKYFASFSTQWSVAVAQAYVRVLTDAARPLNIRVNNSDNTVDKRQQHELVEYTWQQTGVPALDDEGQYPGWYSPYAYIEVSEFSNWQDVVNWALPLYDSVPLANEALLALEQKWQLESHSKQEYVEKVIHFVQNQIRYFGIEIGSNTHKPYSADEVFERKYGDCKDKTNLMITLLRRAGIDAYPALVSSYLGTDLANHLPAPGAFDHVITYFTLNGTAYWVDGTRSQQFGPLEAAGEQYFSRALLVKPTTTDLTIIPEPVLRKNSERTEEHFSASNYDGNVTLQTVFEFQGDNAEYYRSALQRMGQQDYEKHLQNYYQRQFPGAELMTGLTIKDDRERNSMLVTASFSISNFWDNEQNKIELPLYAESLLSFAELPDRVKRKMPLALEQDVIAQHIVSFQLPEIVHWQLDEQPLTIEADAMIYSRSVALQPTKISVTHHYQSKKDHVSSNQIDQHIRALKKLLESIYFSVSISDSSKSPDSKEQQLRQRFQKLLNKV
ncbi:DUF3857 domain-containing transglutaminase family protein [Rheinheimera baltica]|uniref:DUF3857 domain-containing transglutaminase family protein n=1 Tax=Rheinheimera baltica TaxID=67576 RepID=UPI00041A7234|nr:DUF3857 domain-containing transglutaminase family protein [Rheinheimera baltica]